MKKAIFLCLCFVLFPSLLMAQTSEEKRRIEQKKRESLQPSEAHITKEKEAAPLPFGPPDIAYFTDLMPKKITFRYDACKAMVILMGLGEEYVDLDSQIAFLREKNLIPKKYETEFNPMEPLRKGLLAYMFCKTLKIKGGINLMLLGVSERYAIKELAFEGIMPSGNVNDIVSGEELVLTLMQSSAYMEKKQGSANLTPRGRQ